VDDDLAMLCQSCGLCCDGSLFGRVPLDGGGASAGRRLRVVAGGASFEQPCSALGEAGPGERRACAIYEERPRACRAFVCELHERHRREGGPLEPRLAMVRRTRELLARAHRDGPDSDVTELRRLLEAHFARAR